LLIKRGAKLVTNAEDVIERLATPGTSGFAAIGGGRVRQRNLFVADGLSPTEKKI